MHARTGSLRLLWRLQLGKQMRWKQFGELQQFRVCVGAAHHCYAAPRLGKATHLPTTLDTSLPSPPTSDPPASACKPAPVSHVLITHTDTCNSLLHPSILARTPAQTGAYAAVYSAFAPPDSALVGKDVVLLRRGAYGACRHDVCGCVRQGPGFVPCDALPPILGSCPPIARTCSCQLQDARAVVPDVRQVRRWVS